MKIQTTFLIIIIAFASVSVVFAGKLNPIGRQVCWDDRSCNSFEVCEKNVCIHACEYEVVVLEWNRCSKNARCDVLIPHRTSCVCLTGYSGNPYTHGCNNRIPLIKDSRPESDQQIRLN